MIRLLAFRKIVVVLCVFSCIALRSLDLCLAQRENEEPNVLPLSTAYVPGPGQTTGKTFYDTVQWEGQEYRARKGTTVLMQVILDPATAQTKRAKALEALARLRNRDTIPQLVSLYDALSGGEDKLGIILCIGRSEDLRGLPFFAKILEQEQNNAARSYAAAALAAWNVRRGVKELIDLFECKERLGNEVIIGEGAIIAFGVNNRLKQWGFPEDDIRKSIEQGSELSPEERVKLWMQEVKVWFAQNKDRFPDWKLGDPLPAAPKQPPIPPGPEDVLSLSAAFRAPPTIWTVAQKKEEEVSWQG